MSDLVSFGLLNVTPCSALSKCLYDLIFTLALSGRPIILVQSTFILFLGCHKVKWYNLFFRETSLLNYVSNSGCKRKYKKKIFFLSFSVRSHNSKLPLAVAEALRRHWLHTRGCQWDGLRSCGGCWGRIWGGGGGPTTGLSLTRSKSRSPGSHLNANIQCPRKKESWSIRQQSTM